MHAPAWLPNAFLGNFSYLPEPCAGHIQSLSSHVRDTIYVCQKGVKRVPNGCQMGAKWVSKKRKKDFFWLYWFVSSPASE